MFKIISEENMKISKWSGGITKELYIFPEDSLYSERNFQFRISIATTETENSTFTKLNGVDRVISILDGTMEIFHEGHYNKILNPYEIDRFKGDWNTTSKGKVTDFNLMLKGCKGDFFYEKFSNEKKINFDDKLKKLNNKNILFIYCIFGEIEVKNKIIKKGQLLLTDEKEIDIFSRNSKIFYGYIEI